MKKENKIERGSIAVGQIIVLVVSLVAFSYMIGSEFKIVSAQTCNAGDVKEGFSCVDGSWVVGSPSKSSTTGILERLVTDAASAKAVFGGGLARPATKAAAEGVVNSGTSSTVKGLGPKLAKTLGLKGTTGTIAGYAFSAAIAVGVFFGVRNALREKWGEAGANIAGVGTGVGAFFMTIGSTGVGLIFAGAGLFIGYLFSDQHKYKHYEFTCNPWTPPTGGANCEVCNHQEIPCTQYMCKSLGLQCDLLNNGTAEQICAYNNTLDTNPPVIQPWLDILTTGYKYSPDNAVSPPNRGVKIVPLDNESGCIKPFTPLKFGVSLNQPGKCKIDTVDTGDLTSMNIALSNGMYRYNHSFQMSIPSNDSLAAENITLQNGGVITIFTRCKNMAGRENLASFAFRFCVDQGPDKTQVKIVDTSITNGAPISFGSPPVPLRIYLNKPADCKWSHIDQTYQDMPSENQMTGCTRDATAFNSRMLYSCDTTLTGLVDREDNDFYFRCLDQPHLTEDTGRALERNEGPVPSYKFTLKGTEALVIDSAGPNNTVIRDSTSSIRVNLTAKTSAGYKDGEAICSYENTADEFGFIEFAKTGENEHSQDVYLGAGSYNFNIQCIDLGGNVDTVPVSFKVEIDTVAPSVVRVFRQENSLRVITNEEARCVYSNVDCTYQLKDGINMTKAVNGTQHSTPWNTNKVFYIKCSDMYGNQPLPNVCNIVAKPFEMK